MPRLCTRCWMDWHLREDVSKLTTEQLQVKTEPEQHHERLCQTEMDVCNIKSFETETGIAFLEGRRVRALFFADLW